MALPDNYLQYPQCKYGMDHDLYTWSMLADRAPVEFPDGKKIAFWVNVSVQHFPLNSQGKPFKAPGSLIMPYPDLRHYTLRDYGNRIGIYRILKALEKYNVQASFAVNGIIGQKYPALIKRIAETNSNIIAHGWDMDTLHYEGMTDDLELEIIDKTFSELEKAFGKNMVGWLSPARSQSASTAAILAARDLPFMCDWVNDDMPFNFKTSSGNIVVMPLSYELEDQFVILNNQHSEASYAQQVIDSFEFLCKESETKGGRILSLNIHPWMMGQPHRIKYLEQIFAQIMALDLVWNAGPSEILNCCKV
jgi:allantoinase